MSHSLSIWTIASFIEARVKSDISYDDMQKATGFSYRYIRTIFKNNTGMSLSKYILERRLSNAAFDIIHTNKSLTTIAYEYKFNSYDSFSRAFKRLVKVTPSNFKKKSYKVGRRRLIIGFYAPVIHIDDDITYLQPHIKEDLSMKQEVKKTDNSCILYGVPKVAYSFQECTPFPVALKACLNYMGQEIDYTYIMALSGASFRLRWNKDYWDGGNVDIMNIYEDEYEVFKRCFKGVGRTYQLLKRKDSTKKDFIDFITSEIDDGRPVIAFGIIGPPEACLITGYRDNGNTLLGWNCFQDNKEFANNVSIDECGYFITDGWWENPETIGLISVGEKYDSNTISQKSIIENAIDIMSKESITINSERRKNTYAGGQAAYDMWAEWICDDKQFGENTIIPLMIERLVCQNDAQTMIGEGRGYGAYFIEWVGNCNPEVKDKCFEVANEFRAIMQCSFDMNDLRGGFQQSEKILMKFTEPSVRKDTAALILKAKNHEAKALELLTEIYETLT